MNRRLLPTLVVLSTLAFPALATAQDTTSGYTTTQPTTTTQVPSTQTSTTPATPTQTSTTPEETPPEETTASETTPAPPAGTAEQGDVAPQSVQSGAPAATGTAPSTLAYTGSEAWLVGVIGLLALAGGVALTRATRRA